MIPTWPPMTRGAISSRPCEMELELGELANVRKFAKAFRSSKYAKNFQVGLRTEG